MKKIIFIIFAVSILTIMSCDRFEHNFENHTDDLLIEEHFEDFELKLQNLLSADINEVMNFYHEDYNNDGVEKSDVENFYTFHMLIDTPISIDIELIDYSSNLEITWRFLVTETLSNEVMTDSTITDVLIPTRGDYLFYGNQAALQKVMVELFTATWCPNCPYVESALHELKEHYGSRLSYVEYHILDIYEADGNSELANFYGATAYPHTFINGISDVNGGSEDSYEILDELIQPILAETPELVISELEFTTARSNITGTVKLDTEITESNLKLKFAVIENERDGYHNIVIKNFNMDISGEDYSQNIDFEITDISNLPDDATLMVWVQKIDGSYNDNCKVYNVIEKAIQ